MTEIEQIIDAMSDDIYNKLVAAVELGKWQNGQLLTSEQRASTLQLVMLYQAKQLDEKQHMTISSSGQVNELSKSQLKQLFKGDVIASVKETDL